MTPTDKPSLAPFFKPAFVATLFSVILGSVSTIWPIPYLWLNFLALIVLVWLCIKVVQTAAAYFLKREYASSTLFWYLIVSQVAGGLLALAVVSLFFWLTGISGSVSNANSSGNTMILALVCLLPVTLVLALLLRSAGNWVPAWRPLATYWRPFYAGFKFTGLDGTPQSSPGNQEIKADASEANSSGRSDS